MKDNEVLGKQIIDELNELKSNLGAKRVKVLQVHRIENIVNKLVQFSDNCTECSNLLSSLQHDLLDNLRSVDNDHLKVYYKNFKKIVAHLCKKHKLVIQGSYTSTYMSLGMTLGMSLGMTIGLLFSNNSMAIGMSLGMSFGMSIGLLIGSLMDSDARKKGLVV